MTDPRSLPEETPTKDNIRWESKDVDYWRKLCMQLVKRASLAPSGEATETLPEGRALSDDR